jgi:tetratricopeptide (TPR) repeat protein
MWLWRAPQPALWLAASLILLLPSSSLFPAADLAADRRMYLPLVALSVAVAVACARLPARWVLLPAFAVLVAVGFHRTQVWSSDRALWSEAVRRAPEKLRPRLQLARAVEPREALPVLEEARKLAPEDPAVATETGRVLLALGRPAEALPAFGRALALAPGDPRNYNNRGVALEFLGQSEAARLDFRRALELDPCLEDARRNLRSLGDVVPDAGRSGTCPTPTAPAR